jgi:serine/threonine protein kinase
MVEPAPAALRLGPYVLGERLGLGGMAEVFVGRRAGPHGFAKRFAIKRILPDLARDQRFVAMFIDEARICAGLQHPNIVEVVDFGESHGELFMAMEYVDGVSLARLLRHVAGKRSSFPIQLAVLIARDVLRGLSHAHQAADEHGRPLGLVHRDVSPGNVLISRMGEVKLADFGIVRGVTLDRRTDPGELKGKLGYMSPEQVIGAEVDPRSDVFAVGILLAEMLTASPLFSGKDELEVLTRIHEADLSTLERQQKSLPAELLDIARRALKRQPWERFPTAAEFAQTLEAFAARHDHVLDDAELGAWLSTLGILPSMSGVRPLRPQTQQPLRADEHPTSPMPAPSKAPPPRADGEHAPSGPALLEQVATGRVRENTEFAATSGGIRRASQLPGAAELLERPAFRFGDPDLALATWSQAIAPRTLPTRLYALLASGATGLLSARAGDRERRIFLVAGAPRFVSSTSRDELIGRRLAASGLVEPAALAQAVELRARGAMHLGEILVSMGAIAKTALERELREQLEARFLELFTLRSGTLAFFEGSRSGEEELPAEGNPLALVTRGVREAYDIEDIAALLAPTLRAVLRRGEVPESSAAELGLLEPERAALAAAVAAGTISRLVANAPKEGRMTRPDALRAVFVGLSRGILAAPGANWA